MKSNMICIKFYPKIKNVVNFGLLRFLGFLNIKPTLFRSHFQTVLPPAFMTWRKKQAIINGHHGE